MHFLDFPQHVSANNCHHQGGRSALEATQAWSVLWTCMDYDLSSVISCREMQPSVYRGFGSCVLLKHVRENLNRINKNLVSRCICWLFYFDTTRCSVQLSRVLVCICSYLKSVLRYKFLILDTCHLHTPYLRGKMWGSMLVFWSREMWETLISSMTCCAMVLNLFEYDSPFLNTIILMKSNMLCVVLPSVEKTHRQLVWSSNCCNWIHIFFIMVPNTNILKVVMFLQDILFG
jgi:hypothetical protein